MDPEVLKKAPLFAGLEDEAATALSSAMGKLHLNKGDVLFHEGDLEDRLYIVVSGKIKLGRSGSAGRENSAGCTGARADVWRAVRFRSGTAIDNRHSCYGVRVADLSSTMS